MRRALLVLLLAAVSVVGAAPAAAWTPPPKTAAGEIAAVTPIARAAWPGSPCEGREVVSLHSSDVMDARDAAGMAFLDGQCHVWISNDGPAAVDMCNRLVHEFGHLAGYGHPDEPDAGGLLMPPPARQRIMRSDGGGLFYNYPECWQQFEPHTRAGHAEKILFDELWGSWSIHCARMRCTAANRHGVEQRYSYTGPKNWPTVRDLKTGHAVGTA